MSRILVLTPQIPYPPRQGTALRNWGVLKGLAARHSVSLLTFAAPDQVATPSPALVSRLERIAVIPQPERTMLDRLLGLGKSRRPDLTQRLFSPAFQAQLAAWLTEFEFDWVLAEGLEMAPYLELVWARPHPPRVAFDDHNCEYLLQKRAFLADLSLPHRWIGALYSFVQWKRLRRYEAQVCRRADLVITVSDADAEALRAIAPNLIPLMLPNGINVAGQAEVKETVLLEQPAFVFTGTMDFRPNVDGVLWFAEEIWPQIRAALPTASIYIVGKHPHRRLHVLRDVPGFIVTGAVPDTRPYIKAAAVYVVPLRVGGGTRFKILEAAVLGKAIVSTTLGAEGFPEARQVLVLADDPDAFAHACVSLAQDTAARAEQAERALGFAATYDWNMLLPRLLERLA